MISENRRERAEAEKEARGPGKAVTCSTKVDLRKLLLSIYNAIKILIKKFLLLFFYSVISHEGCWVLNKEESGCFLFGEF